MKLFSSLIAGCVMGLAGTSRAVIADFKQFTIEFTNSVATNQATWPSDRLTLSSNGLGWDGEAAAVVDGWIQTKPVALGLSWRPTAAATVRVVLQPLPREFSLPNGQKMTPFAGKVFVRYSPDLKHWSSWQALNPAEAERPEERANPGRHFKATVQVPDRDRDRYNKLLTEYTRQDVPWGSDEEAAVRWIVGREPDFFERQIPFIGYVEFLFEAGFYGGQRIRSFHVEMSYAVSGISMIPRDQSMAKESDARGWNYVAPNEAAERGPTKWAESCLRDFEAIKPGMTRAEVERRFQLDGGLQSASPVRFVHTNCPYFKADVEFEIHRDAADHNRAIERKDDKVIRVSKPYLARPFID
jgi:hypothetical protein